MDLFIPHFCPVCGQTEEAKFVFSGPHVKQVCGNCDAYVKFVSKSVVPDATETRLKIWSITQDVPLIDAAKEECKFVDGLIGLEKRMMCWRLYIAVRKLTLKWA
ncbi:MAG: hypothetical protein EOO20_01755 [Chryseobacterium sp.]|nr:MAG: hypothetical protein EOO20_01755 [Chryseobacterium sp.]